MTSKERIANILAHRPVDRIGLYEHFWGDTHRLWGEKEPALAKGGYEVLFDYDMREFWAFNLIADLDFGQVQIAEDEDTVTKKDGNYATLRRHKFHDSTPEHIAFDVDSRDKWETLGFDYKLEDTKPPSAEVTEQARDIFRRRGISTY